MKLKFSISLGLIALSLFTGCASKQKNIQNQTALYWHNSIYHNISQIDLDTADDRFVSLEVEHPNSQYIPIDLLLLAQVHEKNGDYQLALFYMNEYEKRYANRYEKEWCEYKKAKIKFFALKNAYTNQKEVQNTLIFINNILNKYPNSVYNYELNTMKKKLELTTLIFDNQISTLYKKLDKPKAAKLYKRDIKTPVIPPQIPWYKRLFYW
jgi:outer membrane protein assembly factor BamD